jgi:hypothetical protein
LRNKKEKGHHIHFPDSNGEIKEKIFNFESIGKTIEYFKNNWKNLVEGEQNE